MNVFIPPPLLNKGVGAYVDGGCCCQSDAVVDTAPAPVLVEPPTTKTIPTNHCHHHPSFPTKQTHYHRSQSTIYPGPVMSQN
jgi:hypothetical protein